ncbi:general odorant-binding protein 71 [Camponotus floridanus]|uniref:general odorant-binding protein 71 n=1 Tax=Camponotus floridanus TaxID=104421 RepID=UPI000DC67DE3|nr:general odorant-binding protein 71 [Camponotus floridanus]
MVKVIFVVVLFSVCLFLVKSAISLKCRTGAQHSDQFQKIMQVCKKRSTGDNSQESSLSEDDDNKDHSLDINIFDTKFLLSNKFYNADSFEDSNNNRNRWNDQRNNKDQHYSFNYTNGNRKNARYSSHSNNREESLSNSNNKDFNYSDGIARLSYDQMYNTNSENKEREQVCLIQCFFNELNIVDQRGFPKQDSIIQLMTHNLRNSELQDFIVEAIVECFHYLDMRQDKCYYSQNLLTCLNEKGKERCEDWNNY